VQKKNIKRLFSGWFGVLHSIGGSTDDVSRNMQINQDEADMRIQEIKIRGRRWKGVYRVCKELNKAGQRMEDDEIICASCC